MKAGALIILSLISSLACAAAPLVLSDEGYGVVRFGANLKTTEKLMNQKAVITTDTGEPEEACNYAKFSGLPGIMFMVESGKITRADVQDPKIPNSAGIQVGMPVGAVRKLYPRIQVKQNVYDNKQHDLVLKSRDGKRAFLFEEVDGKIKSVRAGLEPSVEYIEGCL